MCVKKREKGTDPPPKKNNTKLRGICGHRQLKPCLWALALVLWGCNVFTSQSLLTNRRCWRGIPCRYRRQDPPGSQEGGLHAPSWLTRGQKPEQKQNGSGSNFPGEIHGPRERLAESASLAWKSPFPFSRPMPSVLFSAFLTSAKGICRETGSAAWSGSCHSSHQWRGDECGN